jgi:hypothetical protein
MPLGLNVSDPVVLGQFLLLIPLKRLQGSFRCGISSPALLPQVHGDGHRSEDSDDEHHHQELNQRESAPV